MAKMTGFAVGMMLVAAIMFIGSGLIPFGQSSPTTQIAEPSQTRQTLVRKEIVEPVALPAAETTPEIAESHDVVSAAVPPPPEAMQATADAGPTTVTAAASTTLSQPAATKHGATIQTPTEAKMHTTADEALPFLELPPPPATIVAMTPQATPAPESQAAAGEPRWHSFWRPFRTELSAKGFTQRLEQITGLDYRVVKVEAGEYHVAFAFNDEQQRQQNLSAIEAATGLRLQGANFR